MIRKFSAFLLCVLFLFALSVSISASDLSPIEYAYSIEGVDPSYFPFDTSSAWCVRFARWFNEQFGIKSYSDYNYTDFILDDSVDLVYNQDELEPFDWVLLDYEPNGSYNHCVVYLGNNTYVGGNENGTVRVHENSPFDVSFVGVRAKSAVAASELRVLSPVGPSDTTGFKAVLLNLIGPYDAIVNEYQYTSSQGYVSYVREITPDYIWMISAAVFVIILYCIFRLTSYLVGGKKR